MPNYSSREQVEARLKAIGPKLLKARKAYMADKTPKKYAEFEKWLKEDADLRSILHRM